MTSGAPASRRRAGLALVVGAAFLSLGGCPGECRCSVTTERLPIAVLSRTYAAHLEARTRCAYACSNPTETAAAPEWRLRSGRLPPGLILSQAGAVTGVPTSLGTFRFAVTADCFGGLIEEPPPVTLEIVVGS